jgi:hypothetical protein
MRIQRSEVRANKLTHLYIFSDDKTQKASRGMAETFEYMPHCFPIFTRLWCCADPRAQWTCIPLEDYELVLNRLCFEPIRLALKQFPNRTLIIVPKIGEGCSRLKYNAPKYFKVIQDFLDSIRK